MAGLFTLPTDTVAGVKGTAEELADGLAG